MTNQRTDSNEAVINEALTFIDGALAKMMQRELVSTGEVADLLLDVRTLLTDVTIPSSDAIDTADLPPIEIIEPVTSDRV